MSPATNDEEIIQRIREGDRECYGLLEIRYRQDLTRLARKFVRNPHDAEDAVQRAHISALRHFDQYEGRSPFVAWMFTITANEARTTYRRNRYSSTCVELQDSYTDPQPTPEQRAISGEFERMMHRALDLMPPEYSTVFRLREVAELSTEETGRRLGLTKSCVKTRLLRARLMLRTAIEPQLGRPETPAVPARARSPIDSGGIPSTGRCA